MADDDLGGFVTDGWERPALSLPVSVQAERDRAERARQERDEREQAERERVVDHWRPLMPDPARPYDHTLYDAVKRHEDKRTGGLKHWREVMARFPLISGSPLVSRPQWEQVCAWAEPLRRSQPPGNLVLAGDRGLGKTWDILHVVEDAYKDHYIWWAEYVDRQAWLQARPVSQFAEHDGELLRKWQGAHLLVLDDLVLGDSPLGDRDAEFLYLILNHRCNAPGLPTVLLSNLADLRKTFGYAVSDRLRSPRVTVIEYRGSSLRGGRS